ncbi:MAG: ATP-binding cassette domain-containing protein [Alphaproteobacteria bacterium]|nr:ATP-binding cassette domain-containing protein [Alphaproteobacteria bacterium]
MREHVRPHLGKLALAALCMIVAAAATALTAQVIEPALDEVFIARDREMLIWIPLAALAIAIARGLASYGQAVLMSWVGQRIIADLQIKVFAHLMRLELAFFHDTASGKLISRLTNDVNAMRGAVSNALTSMVKDIFTLLFLAGVMIEKDWKLSLIACVLFPVAAYPIMRIGRRMRKVSKQAFAELGVYTARLNEAFQSTRHVKAYGREDFESARTAKLTESVFRLIFKALRVRAGSAPIMETLGALFIAAIIGYGGLQVIDGTLTAGAFFAFMTAVLLAYQPLKSIATLNMNLQEGLAAAERVFDLIDTEATIKNRPNAKPLARRGGSISLRDVTFSYGSGKGALHQLSLEVPEGRTAALVGASGAGKSTVLNLIPRFYDVDGGAVLIGGTDVRDLTLESLRAQIALVSQEAVLFDDTVRANIAYGRLEASTAEIEAAARAADAHEFIAHLTNGYDTVIGEHGVKLSGGQRQRVLIARAMLKDAPILLLDEATSALDSESERQVQVALQVLMKGRTTLVIAHRLSTVQDADVIFVLDEGRVIESGTNAELLAHGGAYARFHALQFDTTPEARAGTA